MGNVKAKKILIVEDEVSLRSILANRLKELGYEIFISNNGRDGLIQATQIHPDLIILDLIMPGMGGFGMMRELRLDDWGRDARVLVLTNMAISEEADGVKKLGALDVLVKSNHRMEDITKKIGECLAKTSAVK